MFPLVHFVAFQIFFFCIVLLFEKFCFYIFITLFHTEGSCLLFVSSTLQFPTEELRTSVFVVSIFLDFIVYTHQYLSHLHNACMWYCPKEN